ncbi:MAG: L-serine ammonia-lyase, iron-sulfur-dependent, subunit alpha [Erysipelotrichaceae bacterium]|nr:L-serine ammonia-lyase, iron-sulfur-dependent, subunit alpha [Erysipelotrichaceae bacterium]
MRSIKTIFKIGQGPSSSHTVGPFSASNIFLNRYPEADKFKVVLFGSMASTGGGHGTMSAIEKVLPNVGIVIDNETKDIPHPNTLDFYAYKDGKEIGMNRILSIGGGVIEIVGEDNPLSNDVYPQKNFSEILDYCKDRSMTLQEFVYEQEDSDIKDYLLKIWKAMEDAVERGLNAEGVLPGGLGITRKAKMLYNTVSHGESADITMERLISAFSYAVMEENADQGVVVTAPTCGSCGIIPSLLYYLKHCRGYKDSEIIDALAVSGLVGNVIATNASISGAECGCQAEIGSACSMAAAGLAALFGLNLGQIEYSAEVAMEHNLGLTCDPVKGLVQIPCIERNAVAAHRAMNAVNLARFLYTTRRISFDAVVETMYKTGKDMNEKYRETAHGGLAQIYKDK